MSEEPDRLRKDISPQTVQSILDRLWALRSTEKMDVIAYLNSFHDLVSEHAKAWGIRDALDTFGVPPYRLASDTHALVQLLGSLQRKEFPVDTLAARDNPNRQTLSTSLKGVILPLMRNLGDLASAENNPEAEDLIAHLKAAKDMAEGKITDPSLIPQHLENLKRQGERQDAYTRRILDQDLAFVREAGEYLLDLCDKLEIPVESEVRKELTPGVARSP